MAAYEKAHEWGDRIPIGLFYREEKPIYEEEEPALKDAPLVKHSLGLTEEQGRALIEEFL